MTQYDMYGYWQNLIIALKIITESIVAFWATSILFIHRDCTNSLSQTQYSKVSHNVHFYPAFTFWLYTHLCEWWWHVGVCYAHVYVSRVFFCLSSTSLFEVAFLTEPGTQEIWLYWMASESHGSVLLSSHTSLGLKIYASSPGFSYGC